MADETKPTTRSADAPKSADTTKDKAPKDVAVTDDRARGAELTMSDLDATTSHLAAQNQVPQEGKPVKNPPQPEPPKDSNLENQDRTGSDGMSVVPKDRRVGQGFSADDAGLT